MGRKTTHSRNIHSQPINSIPIEIIIRSCVCARVRAPIIHTRVKPWVSFFRSHPPSFLKGFFLARNLPSRLDCLVRKPQGYACLHLYHIWVSGRCGPNSGPYACIVNALLSHLPMTSIQGCTLQSNFPITPIQGCTLLSHLPITPIIQGCSLLSDLPITPIQGCTLQSDLLCTPHTPKGLFIIIFRQNRK